MTRKAKNPLSAGIAAAELEKKDQGISDDCYYDLTIIDNPPDAEAAELRELAILLATLPTAALVDIVIESVGDTAAHQGLTVQGNDEKNCWGPVSGALRGAIARPMFCLLLRPTLTRRILGNEIANLLLKNAEAYFDRAYQFHRCHSGSAYLLPHIGRRCWQNCDRHTIPPHYSPSIRDLWRENRQRVRSWPAEKRQKLMAQLLELSTG